jgi:hypothetical protein
VGHYDGQSEDGGRRPGWTRTYTDASSTESSESSRGSTTITGIAWDTESSQVARSSNEETRLSILSVLVEEEREMMICGLLEFTRPRCLRWPLTDLLTLLGQCQLPRRSGFLRVHSRGTLPIPSPPST